MQSWSWSDLAHVNSEQATCTGRAIRGAPAWDPQVRWSAAHEGALGLSFEAVGERSPGAREQAGHLLLGLAIAGFDQAFEEAAQQPTLALGRMLSDLSRVLGR